MALAHLPGGVDTFALERGGHPDVGHQDLRLGRLSAADQLIVVGRHPNHLQVFAGVDEGADPLAHDQVVIRQEDADRAGRAAAVVIHVPVVAYRRPGGPVGRHARGGGASTPANGAGTILDQAKRTAQHRSMRYESCVTSLSWIPSEAITGPGRVAFDAGFTHYDEPPPAQVDDLDDLR